MFCTLICCMDGRFIHILNEYIRNNYRYKYVDTITDAGPVNKIINEDYLNSIKDKVVLISMNKHKSDHIFIAGHSDCAGCPIDDETQKSYIQQSVEKVHKDLPHVAVTGLFVYENGEIEVLVDYI
nr:carbonic anhydrase [uncultured Leptotrichia sp.]